MSSPYGMDKNMTPTSRFSKKKKDQIKVTNNKKFT